LKKMEEYERVVKNLSEKSKERVDKFGPYVDDITGPEGQYYDNLLPPMKDGGRVPNWVNLKKIPFGAYAEGLKRGEVTNVEVWKPEMQSWTTIGWFHALAERDYGFQWHKRNRLVVTFRDGTRGWVKLEEEVQNALGVEMAYCAPSVDISFHQKPQWKELSKTDVALLAAFSAVFMVGSIYLGIVRKQPPMDIPQALEFGQSRAKARVEGKTGVAFSDIAGLDDIMSELLEVVEYLKNPTRFDLIGAKPPAGVLLEGGPGCGKTLIAKAIAGEAGVPFYEMSGSEFVEYIVGVGAARVRDLFKRARVNAPCMIFVDEVDALGGARQPGSETGNEEREQTLNQLLTELDGFSSAKGVIFVGATNRADLLDPALLRPGRFDRIVCVPPPNLDARARIMRMNAEKIPCKVDPDIDWLEFARQVPGYNGADCTNVVMEAVRTTALRRGDTLTAQDVLIGLTTQSYGIVGQKREMKKGSFVRRRVACYFGSKAMAAMLLHKYHGRIPAISRVAAEFIATEFTPERYLIEETETEELQLPTRGTILDYMVVALAGRVGEKLVFGSVSHLGSDDIFHVQMTLADLISGHALDPKLGFTAGPMHGGDYFTDPPRYHTTESETVLLLRAREMLMEQYTRTEDLLTSHLDALNAIVDALEDKEELFTEELERFIAEFPASDPRRTIPAQKLPSVFPDLDVKRMERGTPRLGENEVFRPPPAPLRR